MTRREELRVRIEAMRAEAQAEDAGRCDHDWPTAPDPCAEYVEDPMADWRDDCDRCGHPSECHPEEAGGD